MSVQSDLTALGFDGDRSTSVADFQRGWNLGIALPVDGVPGPMTRAALAISMKRLAAGLPTASPNFSFTEFRCACGGRWADCRRIWQARVNIRALEVYRAQVGPLTVERGCRCPRENARVGGVSNSRHLFGDAADVTVMNYPVEKLYALNAFSGVGYYVWKNRAYPRHVDNRPTRTVTAPARWNYGTAKSAPAAINPTSNTPAPTEKDGFDMATVPEVVNAILNAPLGTNPGKPDVPVTFGYSMQIARNYAYWAHVETIKLAGEVGGLKATMALIAEGRDDLTAEEIREASEAGARAAIEAKIKQADVTLVVGDTPQEG